MIKTPDEYEVEHRIEELLETKVTRKLSDRTLWIILFILIICILILPG